MTGWVRHEAGTKMAGLPVDQLEAVGRDAIVSLTPLPDGSATVSLSLRIPGDSAREVAQDLLVKNAPLALETGA